ncbi:solute carrier organic anion transporter family member 1A2 isoform X1 [Antechinus flavipes]|uniref:solute carrier organic anion transporter family member 1A2 isoform X1 n=1 Tax=Antechinus flavipes TaxID=38775 RepID=UPI00223642F1|nr:solute carrier organic anion transporter family member 1A2 isoform X1 [Antechinus flavipes]
MRETDKQIATHQLKCISKIKMFLLALICAYISKTLSGSFLNSILTQLERQFNLSTTLVGLISGSFEIGNLLLIVFVSYFGTKMHRPMLIAMGCMTMGIGCFLQSLPHFLMDPYEYETTVSKTSNSSSNFLCIRKETQIITPTEDPSECTNEVKSSMWLYVLVGNIIRGIGETPIKPLGISYIEDFAQTENSPLYIGCLETGSIIGPLIGFLLASFCVEMYVDIGSVNTDELSITPSDTRWVGAWWLGLLVCAGANVLSGVPFLFLPKSLPKVVLETNKNIIEEEERNKSKTEKRDISIDFLPLMKSLFCNRIYVLFLVTSILQFNAFVVVFSFLAKYMEQQYGISASEAIFLMGIYNLPPVCFGYLAGGFIMKKFKINMKQAAYIAFGLSLLDYFLNMSCFLIICDNSPVAGLTVSYEGTQQNEYMERNVLADCNIDCNCQDKIWDPVCGDNNLSYMSACLAGCETHFGTGVNMGFQNCSCIKSSKNASAFLGLCSSRPACSLMLQYFLILSAISSFIFSLAAIPGYMVFLRSLKPKEKALGVGLHMLCTRILAGIPAPIYFGVLIDYTCLHWGTLQCGKSGACRIYDSTNFRAMYLGLSTILRGVSYVPALLIVFILRKHYQPSESNTTMMEVVVKRKENEDKDINKQLVYLKDDEILTKF